MTLFGNTKTFQPIHTALQGKFVLYDDLNQFCGAICMFSPFVSNISMYRIIWNRYDMFKTDCDFKMSEISNIACRWVKTMPEVLTPRPLHVHGNFAFSVCKL